MDTPNPNLILEAAAAMFRAEHLDDVQFKIRVFQILSGLRPRQGETCFDRFDVLAAVEDAGDMRSENEIWGVINQMHMLERDGNDGFHRRDRVYFADLMKVDTADIQKHIPLGMLTGLGDLIHSRPSVGISSILVALRQSRTAMERIARETMARGFVAPPQFWRIEGSELLPFNAYSSGSAACDVFSVFAELPSLVPTLKSNDAKDGLQDMEALLERACGAILPDDDPFGDKGAIFLNGDDDYPGGNRPGVPTNALLLMALRNSSFYRSDLGLDPNPTLSEPVSGLVAFVLHRQLPGGGCGAYRYDRQEHLGVAFQEEPNPFITAVTVASLKMAFRSLGQPQRQEIVLALGKCADFLTREVVPQSDGTSTWRVQFNTTMAPDTYSTIQSALTLLRITSIVPERAEELKHLAFSGLKFCELNWNLRRDRRKNVDVVPIRPPTETGPARTSMPWEQSGHAKIVTAFAQAYIDYSYELSPDTWKKIDQAAGQLLDESTNGLWMDFLMEDKVQVAISGNSAMALAWYLKASGRLLGFAS